MTEEVKQRGDLAESVINLLLALVVTVVPAVVAWRIASAAFAPAPVLAHPGTILLATETGPGAADAPVTVSVQYDGATGARSTGFSMVLTQIVSGQHLRQDSPEVIVVLCGAIAGQPHFVNALGRPVLWRRVMLLPAGAYILPIVGTGAECVYTILGLAGNPGQPLRQAILRGRSGTAAYKVSGDRILYALPGIMNWPAFAVTEGFHASVIPQGSTFEMSVSGYPPDLENVTGSPQLPDSGSLRWTGQLNPQPSFLAAQYRLGGQLADTGATVQRDLFISGAFVGVAGGGAVWFLEQLVKIVISVRRREPAGSSRSRPRADGEPEPAAGRPARKDAPPGQVAFTGSDAGQQCEAGQPGPGAGPGDQADTPVSAMLERLKAHGHAVSLQAIHDGLLQIGYVPHSPNPRKSGKRPEPYLRWTDPARGAPAVIYLETQNVRFTRIEDQPVLSPARGAVLQPAGSGHEVKIAISAGNSEQILENARRIKR